MVNKRITIWYSCMLIACCGCTSLSFHWRWEKHFTWNRNAHCAIKLLFYYRLIYICTLYVNADSWAGMLNARVNNTRSMPPPSAIGIYVCIKKSTFFYQIFINFFIYSFDDGISFCYFLFCLRSTRSTHLCNVHGIQRRQSAWKITLDKIMLYDIWS